MSYNEETPEQVREYPDSYENLNSEDKDILNPRETEAKVRSYIDGINHGVAGHDRLRWPIKSSALVKALDIYRLYYTYNRGKLIGEFPKEHSLCLDLLKNTSLGSGRTFRTLLRSLLKANLILSSDYIKGRLIVSLNPHLLSFGGYFRRLEDESADMEWLEGFLESRNDRLND